MRIPGREVVRDDILLLAEGDRVPGDCILLHAVNFSVDESLLTGESIPVWKSAAENAIRNFKNLEHLPGLYHKIISNREP